MPLSRELVTIQEGHLTLAGARFRIAGANNYYAGFASPAMRASVLAAAHTFGFNVLRCSAFLDCSVNAAGAAPEKTWRGNFFQAGESGASSPRVNQQDS